MLLMKQQTVDSKLITVILKSKTSIVPFDFFSSRKIDVFDCGLMFQHIPQINQVSRLYGSKCFKSPIKLQQELVDMLMAK